MATIAKLAVDLVANSASFRRDLNKASKSSESFFRTFQRGAARASKNMAMMGANITAITAPAVVLGATLVKAASNAEEMTSKFNTVFGKNSKEVTKWAENYGNKVGRATSEIQKMGSSVQDLFVPMGFSRDKATEMSKSLTKLSIDVASFNNTQDAATMRDFQSAMVGNHETVRKYGVIITESTLKQELAGMGMSRLIGAALEQAKVQARLNIIMRGTSDAHGDAIKTAGSTANMEKALTSEYLEQSEAMGKLLIPSYNKLLGIGRKVLGFFAGLSDSTKKLIFTTVGVAAATGGILVLVGGFGLLSVAGVSALAALGTAVAGLTAGFVKLALAIVVNPLFLIPTAIVGVAAAFWWFRKEIGAALQPIAKFIYDVLWIPIDNAVSWISKKFFDFFAWILEASANMADKLGIDSVAEKLRSGADALTSYGENSGQIITDAALSVGQGVSDMTAVVGGGIQTLWNNAKDGAIAAKQGFLDAVGLTDTLEEVSVGAQQSKDGLHGGSVVPEEKKQQFNAFGVPIEEIQDEANSIKGIFADMHDFNVMKMDNMTVNGVKSWGKLLGAAAKHSKAMAVIQKVMAIKSIVIDTAQAVMKAAKALPFPANLPGIAFAVGTGAVQLATVRGQAHDGIDNVPNTGTYLLESGERVVDKRLNKDLSSYLAKTGNDNRTQNRSSNATLNFNVSGTDPAGLDDTLQNNRGQFEQMLRDVYAENALPDPFTA